MGRHGELGGHLCGPRSVLQSSSGGGAVQAPEDENESAEKNDGGYGGEAENVGDDCAIFSGLRIVVIAIEQNRIDSVADFALGGFDEAHAQILGREIDAIEIARDAALRCEHHDGSGVGELIALDVVLILEAHGLGEGVDGFGPAGKEVPSGGGVGAAVTFN